MNYKLIIGIAALLLAACNTAKTNVETQSEQLAARMAQLQQRGYMYGHQDDPGTRMCLHAFRLAFHHPVTGEPLVFETPIPRYFGTALHTVQNP